ncbi:hypothetical protein C8R44DRAFT_753309 [Mycena epipterygia]|nr:hypothetical protein C8R44DRAFT_753309 [Mycena epipterygia]
MLYMHVVCLRSTDVTKVLMTFVASLFFFESPPKNKDATKVISTFVKCHTSMRSTCINENVLDIIVPFFCAQASPFTPQDWNYTTTLQTSLDGRAFPYPRGFVLGGSSSTSATITGDQGWSWDNLNPYMRKNDRFNPPSDHHNTIHGFNGINSVSLNGFPSPVDSRIIETIIQLAEFPFNLDMNSESLLGIDGEYSASRASLPINSLCLAVRFFKNVEAENRVESRVEFLAMVMKTIRRTGTFCL